MLGKYQMLATLDHSTHSPPPSMSEYAMAKKEMEGYPDAQSNSQFLEVKEPKLKDRLFNALQDVEDFRNLSMDRQGEIVMQIEELIHICEAFGDSKGDIIEK